MPLSPLFEAYYDNDNGKWWIKDSRGGWVSVNTDMLRLKLRFNGASNIKAKGTGLSEVDKYVSDSSTERNVSYAGPLAGYKSGLIEQHGNRILVTNSPRIIEPTPGPWPHFKMVLDNLLADDEHDQLTIFNGWLLFARRCLYSGDFKPGQCLVLAGPVDCGKSFLQNRITLLLGGRAAKPYQFMAHDTTFNRELFGAEHLMIEDVVSSTDIRARRNFGSRIKEFTVNEVQSCHGKHREGININPMWRMTITVNNEPEDLMVLPPMIDSVKDKFILLNARPVPFPKETEAFGALVDAELPHYLHWLHNEFQVPEALTDRRFGIKSFCHPDLLRNINDLAPEHELLLLINEHCFKNGQTLWKGTAGNLQAYLSTVCERRSDSLFKWGQACATYLTRLSKQFPERFLNKRTTQERYWEIHAP